MRHIGNLPDETKARVFADFLFAKGIKSEIEPDEGAWSIWAKDEERFVEAQKWLEQFRKHPAAEEFRSATAAAAAARAAEAKSLADYHRRVRGRRSIWPKFGNYGVGWLTYSLIIVCVIVAYYSKLGENPDVVRKLFMSEQPRSAGFLPEIIQNGEVWRLFTPMFVHFGLAHIIFNMLWLYNLGCMIEARQSWWILLLVVAGSQLISGMAQYLIIGPDFGGMSGVVYALVGYVWMRGKYDRKSGVFLDRTNLIISLVWLVLCFTGLLGPIANVAHVAGLITGMIWGRVSAHFASARPE